MLCIRKVVIWATLICGALASIGSAQTAAGCSAIVARPNQDIGGANLSNFTPWGGQSEWTRDISADPVDSHSATWVDSIRPTPGKDPFLMPDQVVKTVVVTGGQTRIDAPIRSYPSVSDPGPYPVPLPPIIQGVTGNNWTAPGDKHLTVIDKDNCLLYELYTGLYDPKAKTLSAAMAAVYDLMSGDHQRPYLWAGGSVAGTPWSYHALRYDEVVSGQIQHALTFAARNAWGRSAFTGVASSHQYGMGNRDELPPFGARARLKPDYDISKFSPNMQVVLKALKQYGMVYIDGSIPIDLHVEVDDRWDRGELNQLRKVLFNNDNFEFVQTGRIYNDSMYGLAGAPPKGAAPVISNFSADSTSVPAGTPVTLSWSVAGAGSRIRIVTPGVGAVVGDSIVVTPAVTTTYTLMVENAFGASKAQATVTVDPGACVPAAPVVAISPATQDMAAGSSGSFSLSVTNADSAGCVAERFVFSHTLPLGWTGAYDAVGNALTIAPGDTQVVTLTVTAPNAGARGDTPITAAVAGMAGTVSQTATVTFVPNQSLSLTASAVSVGGGKPATGTVKLANPAPSGGATVALSVSDPVASVPDSVVVPEGATSATFTIKTKAVDTSKAVTISASYLDLTRSISLGVDPATLWFLGLSPATADGGTSSSRNNVFMTGAVTSDTTITMSSSDPSTAYPQATVTIPAGASQAPFTIYTNPVGSETPVQITATSGDVSKSVKLVVRPGATAPPPVPAPAPAPAPTPALADLTLTPSSISGGFTTSANSVSLTANATSDVVVMLSSADPSVTVPPQVTIPAGTKMALFTISTNPVDTALTVAITATYSGVSLTQNLTVTPASAGRPAGSPGARTRGR